LGTALLAQPVFAFDYFQPLPKNVPVPKDNPLTPEKVELGKQLFFDPRLSRDGTHSCNSCHNLAAGADDGRATSLGANGERTRRNAPTLWNIGFQTVLYWDGRAKSLEEQFTDHVADATISGFRNADELIARLRTLPGYVAEFKKVFNSAITPQTAARAIAAFERTLLTPNSRHDRHLRGEQNALGAQELRGKELFRTVECLSCHFGVNFAGPAPGPALGMGDGFYELFPNHPGTEYDASHHIADDLGVFQFDGDPAHKRLWRVPPLRNIALTAPYFHNGSARTLEDAVRIMAATQLKKDLTPDEIADIVAFLNTLTGKRPTLTLPLLPQKSGTTALPQDTRE
jgi:cytochrome c peroxidase